MQEYAMNLVNSRSHLSAIKELLDEAQKEFDQKNVTIIDAVKRAQTDVKDAESALRDAGLAHYAAHPDSKKLPYGLGVRVTKSLVYDADTAFEWAQEHKMALALDKKAFDKIAKASPASSNATSTRPMCSSSIFAMRLKEAIS